MTEPRRERKVVTALFADLVGFTSQAETLDPEDVEAILRPYHQRVRGELERFGGTVEKFIGDAVMAVFGAPVAHEDDPERAVRAALAIRDWAAEEGIELRIGVNTGEALVTIGGEPLATGDVVNTAARLQTAAPTGGVLVGEPTFQATRDAIDYDEHEPVAAKGKADPVSVRLARHARSRVTVEPRHGATLVGRERELALLREALARAREERSAQLVTLVGAPGIGKSRLVYELFHTVDQHADLVYWRQGRCLPYGDGVTFWALGEIVKAQAGILESDTPEEAERKLREAAPDPWVESHLRPLAGLAAEEAPVGDRRAEAFTAWRRFVEGLAAERPLVLVLEDLHWADDDLLDFVDHLVDWAAGVPLLVLCTARPELLAQRPAWGGGKPNALTISPSPLSDADTARLIGELLGRVALPVETQADLLGRAGGNPLYAEQYARMLAERRDAAAVPETVHGLVAARLDLLEPDEKRLLQDAAVLGKTFVAGGLAAVGGLDASALEARLHPLERRDFLRRERGTGTAGETRYTFLHLVVRDVAYGQIPRAERATKHLRAAAWIESLGRPDDQAELLAYHYATALELGEATGRESPGVAPRAARALGEAADRALALNAFAAAARYYERAAGLMPADDPARPGLLLRYSRALHRLLAGGEIVASAARALLSAGDAEGAAEAELILADLAWHRGESDRARTHLDRSVALVAKAPASPTKARVLCEVSRYHMLGSEDEEALSTGTEAVAMAEALGLDAVLARALSNVGTAQARLGDEGGFRTLERSIELGEALNSPEVARAYVNFGAVLAELGDFRKGAEVWRRGTASAARFGDYDMGRWLQTVVSMAPRFVDGDWDELLRYAEETLAEPAHYQQGGARGFRARIRLGRGDFEGAVADALAALRQGPTEPQAVIPALSFAAVALLAAGRVDEATALADELLTHPGLRGTVPHTQAPWFDLSWVLVDVNRVDDLLAAIGRVDRRTRWVDAAEATARGDYVGAARVYAEAGNSFAEAYAQLRAAQAGSPGADLETAVAFFRKAGATAYLAEAESLAAATPRAAREG